MANPSLWRIRHMNRYKIMLMNAGIQRMILRNSRKSDNRPRAMQVRNLHGKSLTVAYPPHE